jgi:hypothetical protein
MTVKELKELIADLPDDLLVTYKYDSGHDYPTFERGYIRDAKDITFGENWPERLPYYDDQGYRREAFKVFVLDEEIDYR